MSIPRVGVVGVLVVGAALLLAAPLARLLLAIQVVDQLRAPGAESWLSRATPEPRIVPMMLAGGGRVFAADLYLPAAHASRIPVLFVPGLVETGKDDARVPPFAKLLARAGFPVVVPNLPSFLALRVDPENLRELAAALDAVTARHDLAPLGRVGLFGVSYAGGIVLLAALDPARAERVPFVATVGAYADLDTALFFLSTGRTFLHGRMRLVRTDPYGQLVFLRTFEEFLDSADDRALLETMAARRIRDPRASLVDLAARLGRQGRMVYDLFEVAKPDEVPDLLRRLPPALRLRLAELSPGRRSFAALRAHLYLAHARDDGTFPASELDRLAARARPHARVASVVLDALQHVEPMPWQRDRWKFVTRDLPEATRLIGWWYGLLGERKGRA